MTRVIPQIVNTKTALRAAVQALPDTVKIQALLGLDGDCDFSLRSSESYPFRCTTGRHRKRSRLWLTTVIIWF